MIYLLSAVVSVITPHTSPTLQPDTSNTSSLAASFHMMSSFPSVPLHMLCLNAFPFFALLGPHILPSGLSLGIISFSGSCVSGSCRQVGVLSSVSMVVTFLTGRCCFFCSCGGTLSTLVWYQQPHCLVAVSFPHKPRIYFRAGDFCLFVLTRPVFCTMPGNSKQALRTYLLNQFLMVCIRSWQTFSLRNSKHFRFCRPHMVTVAYSWLLYFPPDL